MLKRTMLATLAACGLLAGVALQAQQSATVILRSGERVQGQLVDLGADYTLQVNGQERRIAPGDVAAIEFAGGAQLNSDWMSKLSGGQPVVVLRNGEIFAGRLADIHGAGSGQYTIDTPSGRREVNGGDVAQIYFSVPPGMAASNAAAVATSGVQGTQLESGAISVPANQGWVNTGIRVRKGQMVNFRVNGEIQLSGDPNDRAVSAGSTSGRRAAGSPLPNALAGALIGRVGNGPAFGIGNQASVSMPADGVLFLGINDDALSDNIGNFSVVISR
jgi:hypothetical protein